MYTNYIPTILLIENFNIDEIFRNLLKSFSWFLLLWIVCIITWKKGLKKYSFSSPIISSFSAYGFSERNRGSPLLRLPTL